MKITVKGGTLTQIETDMILEQLKRNHPDKYISSVEITLDGNYVDVQLQYEAIPFERIRRITGYLVGTIDRFNNAKRAEVKDRVKHTI